MRPILDFFDGLFKPARPNENTEPEKPFIPEIVPAYRASFYRQQESEADALKRVSRESAINFWMAEIKAVEKAKVEQLPIFYRFALKLREATEGRRLDNELRHELTVVLTEAEEDESVRLAQLDPEILQMEEEERMERALLRYEQDKAYLESLALDQAKEAAAREALESFENLENLENLETVEIVETLENELPAQNLLLQRPSIPEEPPVGSEVAKISLKFPDGSRVHRRFHKEDTIQQLKDFVEFSRISISEKPCEIFPSAYVMVVLGAPPISLTDFSMTIEQAGLYPHPTLISINVEKK